MNLALFDLDNTLLAGDSDFEWGQFLISRGIVDPELQAAKNAAFYADYKAGTLDIKAFMTFQMGPLSHHSRAELSTWHAEFMAQHIRPMIAPGTRALLARHANDLCVIITATNSFVTGPIARELGVPHLIASIPAIDRQSGRFTGSASGTPAFQAGKITRLEDWLESQALWWDSFTHSYFYSDSHNDLPLLQRVSQPVAVDPDGTLRQHAQQMGWQIISLR